MRGTSKILAFTILISSCHVIAMSKARYFIYNPNIIDFSFILNRVNKVSKILPWPLLLQTTHLILAIFLKLLRRRNFTQYLLASLFQGCLLEHHVTTSI